MTDQFGLPTDGKRDSLRARIETAERRNAERTLADNARTAASAASDYTRAHPLTVIGGALAVGLAIGLLTRPGRRVARRVVSSASDAVSGAASSAKLGVKGVAARGGSRLGILLGEAAVASIMSLIDDALVTARSVQERAGELGGATGTQARKLTADAAHAAESVAENSKSLSRKTRSAAGRLARDLVRKTKE